MLLTGTMLEKYLLATAITFGLLALIGWLASKYGPTAPSTAGSNLLDSLRGIFKPSVKIPGQTSARPEKMTKSQTLVLTPQHQLHRVHDGNRTYLLATHPQGTTIVSSTLEARPRPGDDDIIRR